MKTYTIHLIRHGLTQGNADGKYIGRTDLPLSETGVALLGDLVQTCTYPTADVYFCSPLTRCLQTLEIIYPGAVPLVIPDFRECNFGRFEERTAQELSDDPEFLQWMNDPSYTPPEGESAAAFTNRTLAAFESVVEGLFKTGTQSAVIVAHGGTIMAIMSAFGLPRAKFYEWAVAPARGYTIRIQPRLWTSGKVFEVCGTLPADETQGSEDKDLVDLGREAASRAYKNDDQEG
ncbi:MAG: histidine phosphatase family protein [Clostridia bacterium]|nr:histidine phosphatase family protein [Clostridia bacterium]